MRVDLATFGVKWPKGQVFQREMMGTKLMPDLPSGHYVANGNGIILAERAGLIVKNVTSFLVADWNDVEKPMDSVDSDELCLFAQVSCVDLCSRAQNRQVWPFIGEKPKRNYRGDPVFGFKVVVYSVTPKPEKALEFLAMLRET